MKRFAAVLVMAALLFTALAPRQAAASNNDFNEVAKTTAFGALGGLLVGSAVALL
ncbi:MAG: hypothetical protein IT348_05145, partial [Candidatus Eisenbacteria bacterium]|nr:hypothetical protein [Candidatus Eisenbacteria bacterium]